MQINLVFDSTAQSAPQSFRNAIQAAANIIDATFTDNVTINIAVGYGESQGMAVTGGSAIGGPNEGDFFGYAQTVNLLAQDVSTDVLSGINALPAGSSIQGQSQVVVWSAEEKALGLLSPTDTAIDGSVGFATDIPTSDLVAVALHELTHAMGRVPNGPQPDVFDLFRYTSAGNLLFSDATPSAAAYFSLNGGNADIADYGLNSDPSDFLNGGVGPPNDALDEFYNSNTLSFLTRTDILQMEALGFHALVHPEGDYAGIGASDILWRDDNGDLDLWNSTVGVGAGQSSDNFGIVGTNWQVQQLADVNGDGKADILWRDPSTGDVVLWYSSTGAGSVSFTSQNIAAIPLSWSIEGSGDFSGTGPDQVLWRNTNGTIALWSAQPTAGPVSFTTQVIGGVTSDWSIAGVGDFNGDGKTDILWRNTDGDVYLWNSGPGAGSVGFTYEDLGIVPTSWTIQGVGDFNGDGKADILWRNSNGDVALWDSVGGSGSVGFTFQDVGVVSSDWHIQEVGDFNGEGPANILWRDNDGDVDIWTSSVSGGSVVFSAHEFGVVSTDWHIQSNWYGT